MTVRGLPEDISGAIFRLDGFCVIMTNDTRFRTQTFDRPGRIILFENDAALAELIMDCLERSLHTVVCVQNSEALFAAALRERAELVLLPARRGGIDGFANCRALKSHPQLEYLPVMMLAELKDKQAQVEALEAGANDFVTLPLDREMLRARVRSLLKYHRALTALLSAQNEMEQRVAARTAELSKTNRELHSEIAERKRAEESLRQLLAHARCGLWHADVKDVGAAFEWKLQFLASENIRRWLGVDLSGLNPPAWTRQIKPEHLERMDRTSAAALRNGESGYHQQFCVTAMDGTPHWLSEYVQITPKEKGHWGLVGVVIDITEEHGLAEQLRQSQKFEAIGLLAGGIAHDFNNLLTVICGRSELLVERLPAGDSRHRDAELILRTGQRAAALTQQLLAFGRRQVLEPKTLRLNDVVSQIHEMLVRLIGEDIELVTLASPHAGLVRADPSQMEQVILNLAVNSRDAMPRGGKLTIETANVDLDAAYAKRHVGVKPGPYVMLAVSDTGSGMDAETQSHMFEPFFTTKEKGRGTGLGLPTVYGIVKQSGGNIWVYSELGRGTSFKIYLPRVDPIATAKAEGPLSRTARGTETILVVEDDVNVRQLVVECLTTAGYTVLEAPDAHAAVHLHAHYGSAIALLLTDVVLPKISGPELARSLQRAAPGLRVLFMSGYTDNAIGRHGVLEPGIAFLQKPFTSAGLTSKVRDALDRPL